MSIFEAFVLGTVQGVTEFLPVSSSAHLVLTPWLFGWDDPGLAYDVFLHFGTLLAVFIYFANDWRRLIKAGFQSVVEREIRSDPDRLLFWYLILASVPAALAGVLLHEHAETSFRSPLMVASMLAVGGLVLYWCDGRFPAVKRIKDINLGSAMWIGVAQAVAIIPGVSRSASTMAMARFLRFRREDSARFSFLLSFPIILGASVYECLGMNADLFTSVPSSYLVVGFVSSAISGLLSIHWLIRFLQRANFAVFAWYRIGLAGVVLGWALLKG